jgi:hypothetical protein
MSDLEDEGEVNNFEKPTPRIPDDAKSVIKNFISDKLIDLISDTFFYARQLGEVQEYLDDLGIDIDDDDTAIEAMEAVTIAILREIIDEYEL